MSKIGKIKNKENKRIIEEDYSEDFSIVKFISIIMIIMIVLGVFFVITTFVAKKPVVKENTANSVIRDEMVTIGNMLSQKESDYYVLAYKNERGKKTNLDIYERYIKDITTNNKEFKLYKVNLSDAMNKSYISDTNNITDNLEEFKISGEALLHVVDNKIEESFTGLTEISNELNELKGE